MQESGEQPSQNETNQQPMMVYTVDLGGGSTVDLTPREYMMHIDAQAKQAESAFKMAMGQRELSQAFQTRAQTLIWGMAEIRFALGSPQIDDEKEGANFSERTKVKSAFEDDIDKGVLRQRYIELSKKFIDFISKHLEVGANG